MKLYYIQGGHNFGDDLNPWIWDRVLPNIFDHNARTLFVGIGTLLNDTLPRARKTVVFGSGVGYGRGLPEVDPSTWKIYCLRGPLSARALGLPHSLAVTDSAALVRHMPDLPAPQALAKAAYLPHRLVAHAGWNDICAEAGLAYIDPRWPVERVLAAIRGTDVLLTGALHGAIVADALGVPWIPVQARPIIYPFKWDDWCASIGLTYEPNRTVPLWPLSKNASICERIRHHLKWRLVARELARIAKTVKPSLSHRSAALVDELQERLQHFKRDAQRGRFN